MRGRPASLPRLLRHLSTSAPLTPVQLATPVHWLRQHAAVGDTAKVQGWVRSVRKQKGVTFLEVNDGSSQKSLQVVLDDKLAAASTSGGDPLATALTTGCSVLVDGTVVASPHPAQRVEVAAASVAVIGRCDAGEYPLQKKVSVCGDLLFRVCARAEATSAQRGRGGVNFVRNSCVGGTVAGIVVHPRPGALPRVSAGHHALATTF